MLRGLVTFTLIILLLLDFSFAQGNFTAQQKKFAKVRNAFAQKENAIKENLIKHALDYNKIELLLVAFKHEGKLEVHAKNKNAEQFKLIATYDICSTSGELGPKRQEGDGQVPEGFYHINRFNPTSSFHLSLGINYPNISDRKLSTATRLGGDIFIHGSCVTIGCMPMTDEKIKEIYLYCVIAKNNGQDKIPVYIFPFKMENEAYTKYINEVSANTSLVVFWENLKKGYDKFFADKKVLRFSIGENGDYIFN